LQDLQDQHRITFLFVAHDLAVVEQMSHQVGVMYLGRIVEQGSSSALSSSASHPYTRALLASVPSREKSKLSGDEAARKGVEMPSPLNPPSGCPYHPRCPYARELCKKELPQLREITKNQWVACHYAEEIKAESKQS
jgi:peptide/nickel transport system ATP-binding protein